MPSPEEVRSQPVVKVPRGQAPRICRGIEATKRRSIRGKYAEVRQRRARGKDASMARATFTTGCQVKVKLLTTY
jgi:hypothetical protein